MKSVVAINGVKASSFVGVRVQARVQPPRAARVAVVQCVAEDESERLRLNNLSPQEGARRKKTRKGRGYGAGQGGTAGYGMRGQKSRSGSGIRPGFEGGQTPLYRKLPKLRGIAGGMGHGLPDYVRCRLISHSAPLDASTPRRLDSSTPRLVLTGSLFAVWYAGDNQRPRSEQIRRRGRRDLVGNAEGERNSEFEYASTPLCLE